ncbi:heme ABC exporter ATP-binding protein CcmA [soil metagenome]
MIVVEHLVRSFGERLVLDGLSLSVQSGQRVALRGPNGSGKTTILRCVLGTVTPTAGTVTVGRHPAGSLAARALIGASLSQERSFYLRLPGRENLIFFARVRGLSRRDAVREVEALVEELELGEIAAQRCDRCSSGMLQQLALARALLGNPPALLLDEPTRSLDTAARARLWAALDRRPDATVVIATHLDEDLAHVTEVVDLGATG